MLRRTNVFNNYYLFKCKRKFCPVRTNSDGIGLGFDVPGQKLFQLLFLWVFRDLGYQFFQVIPCLEPIGNRGLYDRKDHRRGLGAVFGIREKEVLPRDHEGLDAPFRGVVAQLKMPVLQYIQKRLLPVQYVFDGGFKS